MNLTPSVLIRRTHMYLALFLTPWMLIYALSGLVLNHGPFIRSFYGDTLNKFEKIGEQEYKAEFSADADPRLIGAQVLEYLGLPGTFHVQGGANAPRLVINRNAPLAVHRITYVRGENRLVIEKLRLTVPAFLNRTHFRAGYTQPYFSAQIWGVIVDLVIVSMVFWIVSGIWMWWEIKPARSWGAGFALTGFGLCGLLFFTL